MFKHIPNILTIMRFIFIPIILNFIFQGNYILGIIVFTISGLTDVLDGFIDKSDLNKETKNVVVKDKWNFKK